MTSVADEIAARGPITLADIEHFRPTVGVNAMEPAGWVIVGLSTNFYSTGAPHVVDGELLGFDASVRFTPVSWTWTYGDGASARHSTPGASWAAQGIREFDRTPTSHIYRQAGTHAVDLSIAYRAEYSIAGLPWTSIAGTLVVPSNRLVVSAGSATTVLVNKDCTRKPAGPGC